MTKSLIILSSTKLNLHHKAKVKESVATVNSEPSNIIATNQINTKVNVIDQITAGLFHVHQQNDLF